MWEILLQLDHCSNSSWRYEDCCMVDLSYCQCMCRLTQMLFCRVLVISPGSVCIDCSCQDVQAFMEQCTHLAPPQMFYLTFAVDFSVFLGLSGRLEALATFCTSEAVLVPRLLGGGGGGKFKVMSTVAAAPVCHHAFMLNLADTVRWFVQC